MECSLVAKLTGAARFERPEGNAMADGLQQLLVDLINLRSEIKARTAELAAMEQSIASGGQPYLAEIVVTERSALSELLQRRLSLLRRLQEGPAAGGRSDYLIPLL
jgi:hypothetical protein